MFIYSFFKRYAGLIIVFVILATLSRFDQVTYFIGPVFYIIQLVVTCCLASLFARHLFMRSTVDAYSVQPPDGESGFQRDWRTLPSNLKMILALQVIIFFYLGAAWIAASIAK